MTRVTTTLLLKWHLKAQALQLLKQTAPTEAKQPPEKIIASWRPTHVSLMSLQVPTNLPLDKVHHQS
jgi:hypothetical protein